MAKIIWVDRVKNEILHRVEEERNIVVQHEDGRPNELVTTCVGTAF